MTPYNHSTYYYNELLNSGRQVGDSFYAYVGDGGLLILLIFVELLGWFPRLFWLLQIISPSAFYGESSASAGYSTPSPLCGVHPLWWSQRFFVDACIWDDFLVTSAVLELSTLASLLFSYDSENASFRVAP